jgi:multiple sugar transport system substrate-binding protein
MQLTRPTSQSVFFVGAIIITVLGLAFYIIMPTLSSPSGEKQPVKVYFADHISPAHQRVIDSFNRLHVGSIEVVPVNLPFDKFTTNERKELLARSLRSKSDRLDVFSVDLIWGPRFAKWCEPLDQYFPKNQRNAILDVVLQSCVYDGALVSMPLYIDVGMLYYRKDFLQKLPDAARIEERLKQSITWDELEQLRSRLGFNGRPYYIFQANDYEGLVCNYFELLAQRDREFFNRPVLDFTTPSARDALEQMVSLVRRSNMAPPDVVDFDENMSYSYMLEHNAMFVRGWPNFLENFSKSYGDTAKLSHVGRAALPHIAGRNPASVFGGWNVMISKYSSKKAEALEFVRFLQTKEAQETFFEAGGYIPVNREVYEDMEFMARHPDLSYYRQLLNNGFHRPSLVDYTRISDIISHYVRAAIRGEMTTDAALNAASEMIRTNKVLIK